MSYQVQRLDRLFNEKLILRGHATVKSFPLLKFALPQFSVTKISRASGQCWDKNWEPVVPKSIALQTKLLKSKKIFLNLSGVCGLNVSYLSKRRGTITQILSTKLFNPILERT